MEGSNPSIREDLESFQHFANERLASGGAGDSLDDLFTEWHESRTREEVNQAIRQGLADIDAGRHESAKTAIERIREQFGFAAREVE
jgi:predicted transcriptional regulator